MKLRIPLCVSICVAGLLLSACSTGPVINLNPSEPAMMAGPRESRDLSLEHFQVDFLGQYTIKHAFINGINIYRCYPASPPDNVQMLMQRLNGVDVPGIVVNVEGQQPTVVALGPPILGTKKLIHITKLLSDNAVSVEMNAATRTSFNPLCRARFVGPNDISFGIRSAASQSIQENIQETKDLLKKANSGVGPQIVFSDAARTEQLWGNPWTWYRLHSSRPSKTPEGDTMETWMTPIGDSGYYITVDFNFTESERQKNTENYQRARQLMDSVLQSVVIQKR